MTNPTPLQKLTDHKAACAAAAAAYAAARAAAADGHIDVAAAFVARAVKAAAIAAELNQ